MITKEQPPLTSETELILTAIDELYSWACDSNKVTPDEVLKRVKVIENALGVRK